MKAGRFAPAAARIKVSNFPHRGFAVPNICFQCPGAPCQKACPSGALSRNQVDAVVVDAKVCISCGNCVEACPYGMIELGEQLIAAKCDYCDGDPACVKECFPGALVFAEKTPELMKLKGAQMKQRSVEGSACEKRYKLGRAVLEQVRGRSGL
jgi:Fe-S-cluster-containing hydrogenase component 2